MNQNSFVRGILPKLVVTALSVFPLACVQPESVICSDDLVCPAGQKCAAYQKVCIADDCGDGVKQAHEACDDGNIRDGDKCSANCTSTEFCGNGKKDLDEECDTGPEFGNGCSFRCEPEACGNGIRDSTEECDDGNQIDSDNCLSNCKLARCGDGKTDLEAPGIEVCDGDGNNYRCRPDCIGFEECRNGILDPGEECDDGNDSDEDNCLSTCKIATCGDGKVDSESPRIEHCDPGSNTSDIKCRTDCMGLAWCGNKIVDPGEECDDGKKSNNGDCLDTCKRATCGDGHTNTEGEGREACDDGNTNSCGTCNADCTAALPARSATGTLGVNFSADGGVLDKEIVSIGDSHDRIIFEFDTTGEVPDAHIGINVDAGAEPKEVITALAAAIDSTCASPDAGADAGSESAHPLLRLTVTTDGGTIHLTHQEQGSFGNQLIIESVADSEFVAKSLSGGQGFDCPVDMGCGAHHDCGPGSLCQKDEGNVRGKCALTKPSP